MAKSRSFKGYKSVPGDRLLSALKELESTVKKFLMMQE